MTFLFFLGLILGVRFLVFFFAGSGSGHVQSLLFAAVLLMMGFMTMIIGLQADLIAANRKILEDVQYHVRKMDNDLNGNAENDDEE